MSENAIQPAQVRRHVILCSKEHGGDVRTGQYLLELGRGLPCRPLRRRYRAMGRLARARVRLSSLLSISPAPQRYAGELKRYEPLWSRTDYELRRKLIPFALACRTRCGAITH